MGNYKFKISIETENCFREREREREEVGKKEWYGREREREAFCENIENLAFKFVFLIPSLWPRMGNKFLFHHMG